MAYVAGNNRRRWTSFTPWMTGNYGISDFHATTSLEPSKACSGRASGAARIQLFVQFRGYEVDTTTKVIIASGMLGLLLIAFAMH